MSFPNPTSLLLGFRKYSDYLSQTNTRCNDYKVDMGKLKSTWSRCKNSADQGNLHGSTGAPSNYEALPLSSSSDSFVEMGFRGKSSPRCISKDGICNFKTRNIEGKNWGFFGDVFTSLLEAGWIWVMFVLFAAYFASWSLFAYGWYMILWEHGDLDKLGTPDWKPCITGIPNFVTAFLFSVETQQTTGYGNYHLTDECPSAIVLLGIQSIVGVLLEGFLVGLVFVKISRAKNRGASLIFSRNAVICQREGKLCFMFRVGNLRMKTHLLITHIRAEVVRKRCTSEGEVINFFQEELEISGNKGNPGQIMLFWPTTVVHNIDSSSPLYNLSPPDLTYLNINFEIVVVLEGIVESTGLAVQVRSSFLPSEILWGYRFEELQTSRTVSSGERIIDFSKFHETFPVVTTTLSAAELDRSSPNNSEELKQ